MDDERQRRAAEAAAVREDRAFVSREAERIEDAARVLRKVTFYGPGDARDQVVVGVIAVLETVIESLRSHV